MHSYTLKITGDGANADRVIRFDSLDAAGALNMMSTDKTGHHAELWEGSSFICSIDRDGGGAGVWKVYG